MGAAWSPWDERVIAGAKLHRCISMDSAPFGRYLILLKSSQVLILNAVKDPKVIPFRCLPNPIEPELWRARVHHDHPLWTGVKEGLACWFPKQPNIYSNSLVFEKSREHHLHIGMGAGGQELYELLESSALETHCRQIDVIFLLVFPCQASLLVVPVRISTIDAMFHGPLAPFPHPTWPRHVFREALPLPRSPCHTGGQGRMVHDVNRKVQGFLRPGLKDA